jgi:hypothetical protein
LLGAGSGNIMSVDEENPLLFIIGCGHTGLELLTVIKAFSSVLQENSFGEMSDGHRKSLQVILDCCETPWSSWLSLTELIRRNDYEKANEILSQIDGTGQSCLERNFVSNSLLSLGVAKKEIGAILQQAQQLSDKQRDLVERIDNSCKREIDVWKEIAEYFREINFRNT